MAEKKPTITADMTIAAALKLKPSIAGVLMSKGMHCLGCVISQGETIAQASEVHGIPVGELLDAVNEE